MREREREYERETGRVRERVCGIERDSMKSDKLEEETVHAHIYTHAHTHAHTHTRTRAQGQGR